MGTSSEMRSDAPPLLERDSLLRQWREVLHDSVAHGRLMFVEGAPGIGKTRLCDAAAVIAEDEGFDVLRAVGGELEQGFAWGVVRQLFERPAAARGSALLDGHAAKAAPLLARDASHDAPAGPDIDVSSMAHALFWALANASEDGPVALILDDLHWADESSLVWLTYVERRLRDLPVALLVATRETTRDPIVRLAATADTNRPDELSSHAVRALLADWGWPGESINGGFVDACLDATGGNPFLLCELVRALRAQGTRPDEAGTETVRSQTPERITSWIALRLAALSEPAAQLAKAAAVLPVGTQLPLVAKVAGFEPSAAIELVIELERAGLLVAESKRPQFVHPLVRSATHEWIDPIERGILHRRAARALESIDAGADLVAAQLMSTPPTGDTTVVERLRDGARTVFERGAPELAAQMLERAAEEGCEFDAATRTTLCRELGAALAAAGSPEADRWLEQAFELERDPAQRALDAAALGRSRFSQARFAEGVEAFERGRDVLRDAGIEGELELELTSGWASAVVFTPAIASPPVFEQVANLVQRSMQPTTIAQRVALGHMSGLEMLVGGRPQESWAMAEASWGDGALLDEAGIDEPALWAVTAAAFGAGRLDVVLDITQRVLDLATVAGSPIPAATASCIRSFALLQVGDITGALAESERATQVGGSLGPKHQMFLPSALNVTAQMLIQRGEFDAAREAITLSDSEEAAWNQVLVFLPLLDARGMLELSCGNPEAALAWFEQYSAHAKALIGRDVNPAYTGGWRWGAVEALVQLDRRDEALELATIELAEAERWGQPRAIGRGLRALGRAKGRDGIDELERAVQVFADSGLRLDEAWALFDAGMTLRAAGRRNDAQAHMREALDRADRIESTYLADRAREELRELGARPRRARISGVRALTATERRVARMAAEGLTNREIAERLFVTIHAIRFHLRNSYAKLQVSQRQELSLALVDAEEMGDFE
ncbi:MAG: transcriptional regulator, LuxR family [Thermoleophilia bacterium]|nr:transcriptional regulator, LuxR family [Thermoleophilia bacterium]